MADPSPLVSYFGYSGGYRWHWRQTHDSFPGQPVVLVHGLLPSTLALVPLTEAVAGWAPVFLPDLPGFGLSSGSNHALNVLELASALADWMSMAGAAPAHLVGISCGCQIVTELAVRFPRRVRSLTLVGPTVNPATRNIPSQATALFRNLRNEPTRLLLDYASGYAKSGTRQTVETVRAMLEDRIEAKLPRVTTATLILRGAFDPIAPESWTRHAAELIANGSCARSLPEGAHGVPISHPELVADALRRFTFPIRNGSARQEIA